MQDEPIFEEEAKRLAALLNMNLLDTALDNRFERVTRLVQNMLSVPIAAFNLIDESRQWTKSIQGANIENLPLEQSFCVHTIQGERTLVVNDARMDQRFANNPLVTGAPNIVFYAGCPVHAPTGERIGALCAIDKKPRQLMPREMQILRDLAGILESEIRLDALTAQVESMSTRLTTAERNTRIDNLTRLPNRAGIMDILQREWATSLRNKTPLTVIAADVDHLKLLNEKYGFETGDEVLRQLSQLLLSSLRYEDAVGRLEGGEFLMVLPNCPADRLAETVDRLHRETLLCEIETDKGIIPTTLSIGASAMVPSEDASMTDLLEQADSALTEAKKSGRNKTVVYKTAA